MVSASVITDDGLFFGVVVILVIAGGAGGAWFFRRRSTIQRPPSTSRASEGTSEGKPEAPGVSDEDVATLERVKSAVQDILKNVGGSLQRLLGTTTEYGTSLEKHRESLERTATIEDLRELEQTMLAQVKDVQEANNRYRQELSNANATVKQQQDQLETLQERVRVDFLTQLPNRRALDERLKEATEHARRYGSTFSIVVIDLDHFKSINDTHGHVAGDRILRAVAHLLNDQKRASDFLGRFGGEEFVLVLPETSLDRAEGIAEKIRAKVAQSSFRFQKEAIDVTLSAGVGALSSQDASPEQFLDRVDKALYDAKEGGRNCVRVAPSPDGV